MGDLTAPAGLDPAAAALLDTLAKTADAGQARWLAGYFAGLADGLSRGSGAALPLAAAAVPTRTLTILYGTETGNARGLATALAARFPDRAPTVADLGKTTAKQLKALEDVLVICSTYGEGDPPHPAVPFFELVEGPRAPKLPDVRFAVLSLGDSSYELFCAAGRRLDAAFEAMGATRVVDRVDCDLDYDTPAAAWSDAVAAAFAPALTVPAQIAAAPVAAPSAYSRQNPFPATVLAVQRIVGRHSTKETCHVELDLDGSGLTWAPGAALGVVPTNDPAMVDALIVATGIGEDARDALTHAHEITTATPRFRDGWAALAGADLSGIDPKAVHIVDIVRRYPVPGVTAADLTAILRPLPPRLYSLASAQEAVGDEAHLTVAPVRFTVEGEPRSGVASGLLADRLAPGDTVPVYIQPNPDFALPADTDAPVIMIGPGTGVAPFRAFMQHRAETGATGRNWLFFGDRNFRSDFLYQAEWHDLRERGVLTRIDVAFSRDADNRAYVQDRLRQRADEVRAWIDAGAHVYLCGDASRMAPDVDAALAEIAGADFVRGDHYHRDVY